MKKIALFALAVLAAGCSEGEVIVDPLEEIPTELTFESAQDPRQYHLEFPSATVEVAEDGALVVETRLTEPQSCRVLDAVSQADDEGDVVLRVRITTAQTVAACAQGSENYRYTARIEGLPADAWKLSVIHEFPNQNRETQRVLVEDVEID